MTDPHPADGLAGLRAGAPEFWRANLALAIAGFVCFALLYATQPVLPQLAGEFGLSPGVSSLSVAVGTGAMALLLIPLSLIADRYGRERLMRLGLLGAALSGMAAALAPDFLHLLLARAALGVCIAGVPAAAMAYLGEEFAPAGRGRAMGFYIAANVLGGMCGRFFTAVLTQWCGWRIGLAALGLLGLLGTLWFWRLLPPARQFAPHSLRPGLLLADVRRIYGDPGLPWLFMIAFQGMGAFVGLYSYLGFRLSLPPFGLGPAAIGLLYLLYVMGSLSSAWAGQAAMRLGFDGIILWMSLCMALGVTLTLWASLPAIVLGVAISTFGWFAAHAAASGWVGRRAGTRRGLVSALYLSSYYLGASVIGSAVGWPMTGAGWPGVVAALLVCVGAVIGIALHLRRLGGR